MNVSVDPKIKKTTLDTLVKTLQTYAFRDINRSSPSSQLIKINVDIFVEISKIADSHYRYDFAFHQAINNLMMQLHDAHTMYRKPTCYQVFALQPFRLGSAIDSLKQQFVYVSDLYSYASQYEPSFNLPKYIGWKVVSIDGVAALEAIKKWSVQNGWISKDFGAMFNWALTGTYHQRSLSFFDFPSSDNSTYVLTNGETTQALSLPWLMYASSDITPEHCAPQRTMSTHQEQFKFTPQILKELIFTTETLKHTINEHRRDLPPITAYNITSDVMVIRITSFAPNDHKQFLATLDDALAVSEKYNIPHLILDLRGNGGGSICLGYQVLNRLMKETHPEGRYDIIHSKIGDILFSAGVGTNYDLISPQFWADENGTYYTDLTWYSPGQTHLRGGVVGVYSNRIFHPCDYTPVISYKYKKIIFVTDGLCGSTCAVFSSHLDEVDNVDSVAIGGYAGTKCSVLFSLKFCHYAFDLSSIVKRRNQRFRRVGVM
jgi:hypothetical protein